MARAVGVGKLNRVRRNPRVGQSFSGSLQTKNSRGQAGTVHTYANGRKVFVRPRRLTSTVKPLAGGLNRPAPAAPLTGQHPQYDATPAPAGPPPPAPPIPTVAQPQGGPEQFMDAEYLAWKAQAEFDRNQQRAAWDAEDKGDESSRAEAIRRMMQRRPEDLQRADVTHNKAGLFYSGILGKERGSIEADYVRQQADTNADYDSRRLARDAARQALEQGATLEEAAQLAAAADRKVQRDLEAADARALVREDPEAVASGPTPAAGTATLPRTAVVPPRHSSGGGHNKTPKARSLAAHRARKKKR